MTELIRSITKEKLVLGFCLAAVFLYFVSPISDIDFPFHLKTGEFIYKHGLIPRDDPFSFPENGILTDQKTFVLSMYWLSQVLFYKIFLIAGPSGIILLRATIFSLFIFILWFALRKKGFYPSLLLAGLVTLALLPYALDRPQYFSFLFTLILIMLLTKFNENPCSFSPLIFVPPLMLLWANMHGGFVFGLAILFIYSMTETLKFYVAKSRLRLPIGSPLPVKSLLLMLSVCFLGILFSYINPNGNEALIFTVESSTTSQWAVSGVREYMTPLAEARAPYGFKVSNAAFWVLLGFVCISFALSIIRERSADITKLALAAFASLAALTAVRYIPLFILTALPLVKDQKILKGFQDKSFFRMLNKPFLLPTVIIIVCIAAITLRLSDQGNMFKWRAQRFYPEKAATFLLENPFDGNIFNSYNRGNYLIWRLYPRYRVFQDSRFLGPERTLQAHAIGAALYNPSQTLKQTLGSALRDVMPAEFGKIEITGQNGSRYFEYGKPLWKSLLDKYNIDLVVHEATNDYDGSIYPITIRMLNDDDWILIYLDGYVQIFLRNDKEYDNLIKKFGKPKNLIYDEIILETSRLVRSRSTYPFPYSSLAFALLMTGKEEDAKTMINAAMDLDKRDLVANFCDAYLALKQEYRSKKISKIQLRMHTIGDRHLYRKLENNVY